MSDDLALGLQEHQRGRLEQAAQRYRNVLRAQPNHADALHLLGVALHQQGDHRQAAECIGRAVTLGPGNATYHTNLAEAYRALGNLDRAAECCRTALRLQPRSPEAANNLGLVLLAQGKTDEAILQFQETLRIKPDYAMACNHPGNARCLERAMTERSPAEAIFFAALEKAAPADRAAFLDEACAPDEALGSLVERLLAAHPQVGDFLECPVLEAADLAVLGPQDTSGIEEATPSAMLTVSTSTAEAVSDADCRISASR
jgi:tetratricopeptide (TPR) repeat protein